MKWTYAYEDIPAHQGMNDCNFDELMLLLSNRVKDGWELVQIIHERRVAILKKPLDESHPSAPNEKEIMNMGVAFSQNEQFKHSGETYRSGIGFGYCCGYQDGLKAAQPESEKPL
jgi:hypothetical protein